MTYLYKLDWCTFVVTCLCKNVRSLGWVCLIHVPTLTLVHRLNPDLNLLCSILTLALTLCAPS